MPMQSQAQRAYLHIHHPEMAERWERETPKGKKLPRHKRKTSKRGKKKAARKSSRRMSRR